MKKFLCILLLCVLLITACSNTNQTKDMGEVYSLALDAYMPIDEGLNGDMEYIAIDMSNFKDINETDKKYIKNYFNKYNVEVIEATLGQLKEMGLYDPKSMVLNGVLLGVEKTEISNKLVVIEGSKYRAGNGAIGIKVVVEYKNGKWKVKEANGTWIS